MLLNTFFAVSMVFPNNPLSFDMLSASDIMLISYRIRHHVTNSMKHKCNVNTNNNTSVITYYRAYITFSKAPGLHCQGSLREIFAEVFHRLLFEVILHPSVSYHQVYSYGHLHTLCFQPRP